MVDYQSYWIFYLQYHEWPLGNIGNWAEQWLFIQV